MLSSGDEIIAVDDIYGGAFRLFTHIYKKFGITVHYVDTTHAENIVEVLSEKTKLIWIETTTNPTLKISDIARISKIAQSCNAWLVVDNTFASPLLQKPLNLGADIVLHSGTKYLGGHSDLLAGIVTVKNESLAEKIKFIQNASGGILGPQDCWLLIRGIETLALRVPKQSENALKVAHFLSTLSEVDEVYYPGLSTHLNHSVANAQQGNLYGGVLSFTLKNDTLDEATRFVSNTNYFKLAESLGGIKSLICQPALMTHKSIPRDIRHTSGVKDSLIRLSCGIEESDDLIEDLKNTFLLLKEDPLAKTQNHYSLQPSNDSNEYY
jgi:cystathionine beta-lyase